LVTFSAQAATRFALLIGNNISNLEDGALRWAEEDARRVHDLLIEIGNIAEGRAILLLGAEKDQIRSAFARLRGQVEEATRQGYRTEVFVFYSGHADSESLHIRSSFLPILEFKQLINEIPADTRVTIIDACRAGRINASRSKGALHGPAFDISLARDLGPSGHVTLTSAGKNEIAQESDELRSSFFTHYMLSGLRGAADSNLDGRVTLAEIYSYTYHHTLATSHGETAAVQHPEIEMKLEGEGEIIITDLKRSNSRLVLPQGIYGDFLIVNDRNGQVVAEVSKSKKVARSLALPSGRYRIQLRQAGKIFAGEVSLEWGGSLEVDDSILEEQSLVAALSKGSDLDPSSWTISSAGLAGTPSVLDSGVSLGGGIGFEHKLADYPTFIVGNLQLTHAQASNVAWHYRHFETRLSLGIGYGYYLGPLRIAFSFSAGAIIVHENARRTDLDRIEDLSGITTKTQGTSIGPYLCPKIVLRIPLIQSWSLAIGLETNVNFIPIDKNWHNTLAFLGQFGVEYEF
jgi:hypothetical protein